MSRTKIKPNGQKKRILQAVADDSPFATLQNAILALAQSGNRNEKTHRVQAIFGLLKSYEESFIETARQVGVAERCLLEVTGGELQAFQFGGAIPAGTKLRVVDSEGTPAPMLDMSRGRFVKLPTHVEPMAIELELPNGVKKTIVPGQPVELADAEVEPSGSTS